MDPGLLAAALAFVAVGGVGLAFAGQGMAAPAQRRVRAVAGGRAERRKAAAVDTAALKRKQTTQEALKELALNEKQSRKRRVSKIGRAHV